MNVAQTLCTSPTEVTHPAGGFEIVEATLQEGGRPVTPRLVTVGTTGPSTGARILCGAAVDPHASLTTEASC